MKRPHLSFRAQIFLLMLILVVGAVLFVRSYFIESLSTYQTQVEVIHLEERLKTLFHSYVDSLPADEALRFKSEIESMITDLTQLKLSGEFQNRDLALYSAFILLFITLTVGGVFLISMNVITRPLVRLQAAVEELSAGNFTIRVAESPRSPINALIRTFNNMVGELEESRRKLLQAQKDMVWREMAKIMAHEIKNPLTPIQLATQRLEHNYLQKPENFEKVLTESTRVIHEEIASLQRLVRAFSEFAKMPALQTEPYDVVQQLEEVANSFQDEAELQFDSGATPVFINADKLQLRQVWTNLFQNAVLSRSPGRVCEITISIGKQNGWTAVTIQDNGTGIPEENLEKIFQPYFTTRERGTGLGLAIVRRIIELHGGEISATSEFGSGTTFTIQLKSETLQKRT
ncbi:MAG: HAMP domain-containing protein [Lentisphaeria bacterium]|nr:HAMP domain-containing protein [Candidatus Neomarinimicrobiota bacterium]MCF7842336.1 HAMP domain-containing protein [Lentisphaeria bacterium]